MTLLFVRKKTKHVEWSSTSLLQDCFENVLSAVCTQYRFRKIQLTYNPCLGCSLQVRGLAGLQQCIQGHFKNNNPHSTWKDIKAMMDSKHSTSLTMVTTVYSISHLDSDLDIYQFACCRKRSAQEAILTTLHTTLSYWEHPCTCVRILFGDIGSAFSMTVLHKLVNKLSNFGEASELCSRLSFLINRGITVWYTWSRVAMRVFSSTDLIYTSDTTGKLKGFMFNHCNLLKIPM